MSREKVTAPVVSASAGGYEARVTVRGHELTVDEPEADGGKDRGPAPTELLLAAVASCYTLSLRWAATRRGVPLEDIEVTATGTYDGLRVSGIRLAVSGDFPEAELPKLLADANRVCYVSNTLKGDVAIDVVPRLRGTYAARASLFAFVFRMQTIGNEADRRLVRAVLANRW